MQIRGNAGGDRAASLLVAFSSRTPAPYPRQMPVCGSVNPHYKVTSAERLIQSLSGGDAQLRCSPLSPVHVGLSKVLFCSQENPSRQSYFSFTPQVPSRMLEPYEHGGRYVDPNTKTKGFCRQSPRLRNNLHEMTRCKRNIRLDVDR